MSATLYTHPMSSNARKASFMNRALEFGATEVNVALETGDNRSPEFLQINPNGMVPALVDGDFKLWESNAIIKYMAAKQGELDWVGSDAMQSANVDRWLHWQSAHWGPKIAALNWERTLKKMFANQDPDAAAVQAAEEQLTKWCEVLNQELDAKLWVAGDTMTVADVALAMSADTQAWSQWSFEKWPNVQQWLDRARQHQAWAAFPSPPAPN